MNKQDRDAIITGSIRTLAQLVPLAGGAIAQAWSEYEGYQRNERIEQFFQQLASRLQDLERESAALTERVQIMADFPQLLEDTVAAIQRESDDSKRSVFPQALANLIKQSEHTTPEERAYLLESLESLSMYDIEILRKFDATGHVSAKSLTTNGNPNEASLERGRSEEVFAPLMVATTKLESRGILYPLTPSTTIAGSEPDVPGQSYQQRNWRLMPIGRNLLDALK
jgi:hypothetical protein